MADDRYAGSGRKPKRVALVLLTMRDLARQQRGFISLVSVSLRKRLHFWHCERWPTGSTFFISSSVDFLLQNPAPALQRPRSPAQPCVGAGAKEMSAKRVCGSVNRDGWRSV